MDRTRPTVTIALVDTETTGLSARQDSIIEIAVQILQAERDSGRIVGVLDEYQELHDPGFPIPAFITSLTGITSGMVKNRQIDANRVRALLSSVDLVVAHCAGFDKGFVAQVVPEARDLLWGCSCMGIPWRKLFPRVPDTTLQGLRGHFQTPAGTAHRAMGDVQTTRHLLGVEMPGQNRTVLSHLVQRKLG